MTIDEMKAEREKLDRMIKEAESEVKYFDGIEALERVLNGQPCVVINDPRAKNIIFSNDLLAKAILFGVWTVYKKTLDF